MEITEIKARYGHMCRYINPDVSGWKVELKPGFGCQDEHYFDDGSATHITAYVREKSLWPWLASVTFCHCPFCRERMINATFKSGAPAHYEEWLAAMKK